MSNPFQDNSQQGGYVNPPNLLQYSSVLPVGTPCTSKMMKMPTEGGGIYTPDGRSVIRIPLKANAFLSPQESFIQFKVTNRGTAPIYLQSSAHSFFERLRVESNHTEIDRIEPYGPLMSMLSDFQLSKEYRQTTGSITQGYSAFLMTVSDPLKANDAEYGCAAVEELDDATAQIDEGDNRSVVFTIPLIAFMGIAKYIPLSRIAGTLVLELTLAKALHAVTNLDDSALNYELSEVNYHATLVNFQEGFEQAFDAVLANGQVQIHSPTYRHYVANVGAGSYDVAIPERARSIKSIFAIQRPTDQVNSQLATIPKIDTRAFDGIETYEYQIGSINYPQKPVACRDRAGFGSEAFIEMYKALGLSLNQMNMGTVVNRNNYTAAAYTPGQAAAVAATRADLDTNFATMAESRRSCGKFAFGLDTESMTRSSPNVESGLNTKDLSLPITLHVTRNGVEDIRVDIWTLVDQVITLTAQGDLIVSN